MTSISEKFWKIVAEIAIKRLPKPPKSNDYFEAEILDDVFTEMEVVLKKFHQDLITEIMTQKPAIKLLDEENSND